MQMFQRETFADVLDVVTCKMKNETFARYFCNFFYIYLRP